MKLAFNKKYAGRKVKVPGGFTCLVLNHRSASILQQAHNDLVKNTFTRLREYAWVVTDEGDTDGWNAKDLRLV